MKRKLLLAACAGLLLSAGFAAGLRWQRRADYLRSRAAIPQAVTPSANPSAQVVCDGNSLTVGQEAPEWASYPACLGRALGPDWRVSNVARGAQATRDMAADATADVDARLDPRLPRNVLVAWEATNDLYFGASAAEAADRIASYCRARRAAGWRVLVLTVLPRAGYGTPADFEARRQACNDLLRSGWSGFADGLVDVALDWRIGRPGAEANPAYYADRTHLTADGYAIVADHVAAAILSPTSAPRPA